jgi:hypothetical protein
MARRALLITYIATYLLVIAAIVRYVLRFSDYRFWSIAFLIAYLIFLFSEPLFSRRNRLFTTIYLTIQTAIICTISLISPWKVALGILIALGVLAEAMVQALFEQNPAIRDLDDFLEQTQTLAFIVIQNDIILYERYFNGASPDSIVTSYSVAKAWNSALIGAAIADGFIESVDDPITDYLPELAERDPAFANITIHDLLRMSSGIKYEKTGGLDGDDAKTYYYHDLRQLALEETIVIDPPGSYWLYNNYHPLLLGLILERATGIPVAAYLETSIWQPIGMEFDGS